MKKLKITGLDLVALVVFVALTIGGGAGWYILSGNLSDAQIAASVAKDAFDKYSADKKFKYVVSHSNGIKLETNINTLQAQLDPLIQSIFLSKDNQLSAIVKEDPVAWKHDLDDHVRALNVAAKRNGVIVPQNFYFGFGRYQGQSPGDEQTAVLSKQLLAVQQIATILINAPVKNIQAIRRTYEEDTHGGPPAGDPDYLAGNSYVAEGKVYTAYPFEVDFEASPENLRPVINGLISSPYILILRSLSVQSNILNSPMISDLDRLAGPPPDPGAITSPGEVAQAPLVKGPQFLFGNATIDVKVRIDMIEWTYQTPKPGAIK